MIEYCHVPRGTWGILYRKVRKNVPRGTPLKDNNHGGSNIKTLIPHDHTVPINEHT
jgi:hypothetical protein